MSCFVFTVTFIPFSKSTSFFFLQIFNYLFVRCFVSIHRSPLSLSFMLTLLDERLSFYYAIWSMNPWNLVTLRQILNWNQNWNICITTMKFEYRSIINSFFFFAYFTVTWVQLFIAISQLIAKTGNKSHQGWKPAISLFYWQFPAELMKWKLKSRQFSMQIGWFFFKEYCRLSIDFSLGNSSPSNV